MASFVRDSGNSLTPTQHSNLLFKEHVKSLVVDKGMMGKPGSGRPIIMDTTLKANKGDTVKHTFVPYVKAVPLRGQNVTILGNENTFSEFGLDVTVNEVNIPFRKKGKMTDQRVIYNTRQILSEQISRNFAQYNETQIFKVLSGMGFEDDDMTSFTAAGATTDVMTGGNRLVSCAGSNGSSGAQARTLSDNTSRIGNMATTDKLNLRAIEDARLIARTADSSSNDTASTATNTYKMTPIRMNDGEEVYCLYVSLAAARDLRNSDEFLAHTFSLADRGWENSPLAKGALGVWSNVIIKESEHIIEFGTVGTERYARNLFLGADALLMAWAQTMDYTEELIDHERELSVNGSEIRGEKKVTYNGCDMGVLQLISASNI